MNNNYTEMIILGIDPGSRNTGYGLIAKTGNHIKYVASGTIKLNSGLSLELRLKVIFTELLKIIENYSPTAVAVEKIFHSINPQSSLVLGHARGVALLSASLNNIPLFEYSPNQIKSSVTGMGKADKEQVKKMVQILLNRQVPMKDDESDALAAAICHGQYFSLHKNILKSKPIPTI